MWLWKTHSCIMSQMKLMARSVIDAESPLA
jgi:hypothetical protein